jgi:hypothetical protein
MVPVFRNQYQRIRLDKRIGKSNQLEHRRLELSIGRCFDKERTDKV